LLKFSCREQLTKTYIVTLPYPAFYCNGMA